MLSGISIWQLLIVLVIIMLFFGVKWLSWVGGDLGGAVKGFKEAVKDGEKSADKQLSEKKSETQDSKVSDKDQV